MTDGPVIRCDLVLIWGFSFLGAGGMSRTMFLVCLIADVCLILTLNINHNVLSEPRGVTFKLIRHCHIFLETRCMSHIC